MGRAISAFLAVALMTSTASAADKKKTAPKVEESRGTNPLVYAGFGVFGVGLLVGTLYGIDSMHATNTARERCVGTRCPPSSFEFIDEARTSAAISNVAFGVSILGLGVGIYGLIARPSATHSDKDDKPDYRPDVPGISLNVGPGSIALSGSF